MRRLLVLVGLLAPGAVLAGLPVFIDFTEPHTLEQVKLSPAEIRAVEEWFTTVEDADEDELVPHLKRESCRGEDDERGVLEVNLHGVRGDILKDGKGSQLMVTGTVRTCETFPRPMDSKSVLALVRDGKVLSGADDLSGGAAVEAIIDVPGAPRPFLVLMFDWMNRGVTGSGAAVWVVGKEGLEEVTHLGPVHSDDCDSSDPTGEQAAVFFVVKADPLKLVQKNYQRRCGAKPGARWKFLADGELSP